MLCVQYGIVQYNEGVNDEEQKGISLSDRNDENPT